MSILTDIQANPEIGQENAAWVALEISKAQRWIAAYIGAPQYPALAQGYSKSAVTPSTNLSALASNVIRIAANGQSFQDITITLASCTSGAATATELQTQIRVSGVETYDEITVAYDGTSGAEYYTITSGRYGPDSVVHAGFDETYKHVAQAMKLSPAYGGTEYPGAFAYAELDDIVVRTVVRRYREIGVEGLSGGSIDGSGGFTKRDFDPEDIAVLNAKFRSLAVV